MNANSRQVAGTHYQAEYQHWDMLAALGTAYLPGQVTKYVARWRKKNGVQDLKKAIHFLDKYIEATQRNHLKLQNEFTKFGIANIIQFTEGRVIYKMLSSSLPDMKVLSEAHALLIDLVNGNEKEPGPLAEPAFRESRDEWKTN